jgi:hypothetical protein
MGKIFFRLFMVCVCLVAVLAGGHGALLLAAPPVVLDTQTIVFTHSLKKEYEVIDTWLNEAEDLSSFVSQGQTIVFPEGGADPAVYVNRVTDVDNVEPTETTHTVALDVYDSQNYKLRNILLHALPFDKVQFYTRKSADAIIKKEVEDAAQAFAPDAAGPKRIVIGTDGVESAGFKMLCLRDIIRLARACDAAAFPKDGRNLVLPADMWWDLVETNPILKGQLERQPQNGIILPHIVEYYGFKIHKSQQPLGLAWDLNAETKASQGAAISGDVVPCGFMFVKTSVFRASGKFLMFNKPLTQNTDGRAHEFGFQHRFKTGYQVSGQRYSALIYKSLATGQAPAAVKVEIVNQETNPVNTKEVETGA